ncbi:MAG: Gfo/Idh/MocA family oxidoreductase [Edaphobacter sp.]
MKKIKVAIFGAGFMGRVHTESLRRLGNIEVVSVAGSNLERARKFADAVGIERASGDYKELLADPEVSAVHICSPNSLHYEMTLASLKAGKHVICEKPLASSIPEAEEMISLARSKNLANCTLYNIRSYPQVQNLRRMREAGVFGDIRFVQGTYSQDWLFYDTDWNWRIESGKSRTFADIGTHWCDLAEHVTGLRITSLCAELETFIKTRKKPKGPVETFQGKTLRPSDYQETQIATEDFGAMIFRMGELTRGSMTTSQVSAGRKNRLFFELFGTKASAAWDAERPEELWIGHRDRPNELLLKDATLFPKEAQSYSDLPGGHSEGYDATFKQVFKRFYRTVEDRNAPIEYPTFEDGIRQLRIVDSVVESSEKQMWVNVGS